MESVVVLSVTLGCLALLIGSRFPADLVLLLGVLTFVTFGVLTPVEALTGLSNPGLVTVALLYIVAQGVKDTGGIYALVRMIMHNGERLGRTLGRLMIIVASLSAFLNNTPVVATFLQPLREWATSRGIAPSKLLIPLSYAAILGGTCTLIGTSTNVVINEMLVEEVGQGLSFFSLAWVGLPCSLVGLAYVLVAGRWLLPNRGAAVDAFKNTKEYTVEMVLQQGGELVGKTVGEAGLRRLTGLYLVEISRAQQVIAPVSPEVSLRVGDRLVFTGLPESIADLRKFKGLVPADNPIFGLSGSHGDRCFIETVVSRENPLIGETIRDGQFRELYGAAVIAVSRHGQRISKKVGDIKLQPSDTLLLEGHPSFVELFRNSRDFLLVNLVKDSHAPRFDRAWIAWICLLVMVGLAATGTVPILHSAMLGAAAMVLSGCCALNRVRKSFDFGVLLVLASALAFSVAIQKSGLDMQFAESLIALTSANPFMVLVAIYFLTMILTELITNMAAAVLAFSVAQQLVLLMGLNLTPYAIAIMIAASASFISPIGYQTNLMVYSAGGYRFSDFVKIGTPLSLLVATVALFIIPEVWPLVG